MSTVASETTLFAVLERTKRGRGHVVVESTTALGHMPPLHLHDEDEAFAVLEGEMTLHAGGESVRLEAGATFVVRRGTPHTHRAESKRVRYLTATFAASVSRYEDFLRAVGRPGPDPAVWAESSEAAALEVIAQANAITVLGPPGALPSAG